jgi:hypothetical protein
MQADWTKREVSELMRKFYDVANLGATMDERMDAVMGWASDVVSLFLARASGQVKEDEKMLRRFVRARANSADTLVDALSRLAALAQEAGAKNGREVAAFHAGHKAGVAEGLAQVRHVAEMPESDPSDDGEPNEAEWQAASDLQAAHDRGAEAMRVALLREAKAACDQHGVEWLYQHLERRFKGTTP